MTGKPPQYQPASRAAWRRWLRANHTKSTGVRLVFLKGAERQLSYADAVEEALCFGWIDSTVRPIDARSYCQLFTPRKAKSNWSALNKRRAAALIDQGLMTPAGLAAIAHAKKTGTWTALDQVEAMVMPPDFAKALGARRKAKAFFDALAPSHRKGILYWINGVKTAEKRAERIAHAVSQAARGLRPAHHEAYLAKKRSGKAGKHG